MSLSLEAPNHCLCIQSNSAGFLFLTRVIQLNWKHARRHFERNLVKDVHHRSFASRNWLKSYRKRGKPIFWGLLKGKVYKKYTPHNLTTQRRYTARDSSRQRWHFGESIPEFGETHSSVLDVKGDQFQHRLWADPVSHRSRYVYINFQVVISIT